MIARLPVVGVLGSGTEAWADRAEPLGRWLAERGVHLLTGGGGGVMTAVARAFTAVGDRRGLSIGVLPAEGDDGRPKDGYPNAWVELPIATHLTRTGEQGADPQSRNHINVLTPAACVALPGGAGTASEVRLALRYRRPIACFLGAWEEIPGLPADAEVRAELSGIRAFVEAVLARTPVRP